MDAKADTGADADADVTNVVKHFKWEPRGKRRLHKKPGAREIAARASVVATVHPSSILRQRSDDHRRREMARFAADLPVARGLIGAA